MLKSLFCTSFLDKNLHSEKSNHIFSSKTYIVSVDGRKLLVHQSKTKIGRSPTKVSYHSTPNDDLVHNFDRNANVASDD